MEKNKKYKSFKTKILRSKQFLRGWNEAKSIVKLD